MATSRRIEMVAQSDSLIAINGSPRDGCGGVAKEIGNSSELVTLTFSRKLGMGDSSGPEMTGIFDVTVRLNIMLKTKSRVLNQDCERSAEGVRTTDECER